LHHFVRRNRADNKKSQHFSVGIHRIFHVSGDIAHIEKGATACPSEEGAQDVDVSRTTHLCQERIQSPPELMHFMMEREPAVRSDTPCTLGKVDIHWQPYRKPRLDMRMTCQCRGVGRLWHPLGQHDPLSRLQGDISPKHLLGKVLPPFGRWVLEGVDMQKLDVASPLAVLLDHRLAHPHDDAFPHPTYRYDNDSHRLIL